MRQGLIRLISSQPDIQVAGEAANGREAVELARQLRPDVIVMDISMPEMDGIEATRRIKAEMPEVRMIGLSMFEDKNSAQNIINAGADCFVPKTASSAELLKAILWKPSFQLIRSLNRYSGYRTATRSINRATPRTKEQKDEQRSRPNRFPRHPDCKIARGFP
jgi:DNA-binding NarL/FixJ family response regulator